MKDIIAIYAGGFKPPTRGHFEVVKQALIDYPEVKTLYIFIGGGIRDNINQTQSLDIWGIYSKHLPQQIKIEKVEGSPIKKVIDIAKEKPDTTIYLISGTREGNTQDIIDYENKLKLQKFYENIEVKNIIKALDISGTQARQALNTNKEEFFKYLPNELSSEEKLKVYNILKPSLVESCNYDAVDRLEFYKKYYENLSPSNFEVGIKDNNIVIGGVIPKIPIKIVFNLFEDIKAEEAYSDIDAIQTLADGKREVAFIVEKSNTPTNWKNILNVIKEHNLQMLSVKGNPYKAFIVYISGAKPKALRLKELAEKYDGYLASNANEEDTREIGKLLGYRKEDIEKYISDRNITEYIQPADEQTVDRKELNMGIKVEMEHTKDPKIAKIIALQHLAEDPKYYTKLSTLNLEETQTSNFGYRAGGFNPEFPSERLKDRGIGLVDSKVGLLGTGYYFIGNIESAKKLSKELGGKYNTISRIDLSKYKMFKPSNPTEFYNGIRDTTYYLNSLNLKDLEKSETQENIEDAIDVFSDYFKINRTKIAKIFEEYLKDVIKKKDGDLLSNRILFDYDGIDLRNTPYDDFGAGSLIFNGKLKEGTYETISLNSLNENTSYSSDIDYKSLIKELTKYMIKDGWNIQPLPKVIFKHGDSENARDFFGKTAYYDPNTQTIVLYTEGRHPKDIVRSFSHEMVHHEQNLDGRLGDIQTTNTQEDDELNDIEAEANLNGTMTFRNWTDSLQENISPFSKKNEEYILSDIKEYGDILEFKIDLTDTYQYSFNSSVGEFYDDVNNVKIIVKLKPTSQDISEFKFYALQNDKQLSFGRLKHYNPKVMNTIFRIFMDEVLPKNPKILIQPFDYIRYRLFRAMLNNNLDGSKYKIDTKDDPMGQSILLIQKLNESNKPYKHKHGFNDKLSKDPFGISAYALELARGLEEELDEGRKKKKDPKKGTGKKPEGSGRRLYTDEDPKDTVGISFKTKEDIVATLNKASFKAKSHARQSQIINLIHQRVRAAYNNAKDPEVKARLKRGLDYIEKRKEASKAKTKRLQSQKESLIKDHYNNTKNFDLIKQNPFDIKKNKFEVKKVMDYRQKFKEHFINELFEKDLPIVDKVRNGLYIVSNGDDIEAKYDFRLEIPERNVWSMNWFFTPNNQNQSPEAWKQVTATSFKVLEDFLKDNNPKSIHVSGNTESKTTLYKNYINKLETLLNNRYKIDNSDEYKVVLRSIEEAASSSIKKRMETLNESYEQALSYYQNGDLNSKSKIERWNSTKHKIERETLREIYNLDESLTKDSNPQYEIYSDMDGVLTDFNFQFMKVSDGIHPSEYEHNRGTDKFWELIDGKGVGFWVGMPWMPDGKQYWDYIKKYNPILLSAPSRSETSRLGKRLWVRNNLPGTKLILAQAKDKQKYAHKNAILIDDRPSNISQWRSQGGIGILHTSAADTINKLKELGL